MDNQKIYTVEELAEKLKTTDRKIRELLKSGDIEGFKLGREWRIEEKALVSYIEQNKN